MRLSSSAITASLTLTFLVHSAAVKAGTTPATPLRPPQSFRWGEAVTLEARPLELHPVAAAPKVVKKFTKPTKLEKRKKHRRKARRRIRRAVWRIPLPPRVVRSQASQSPSTTSPGPIIAFSGTRLGLDIQRTLENEIDPTPYGALIPLTFARATSKQQILTLRSFAGIDKQIDSTVIGIEAGLGYTFTRDARSKGTFPTPGPSGLDATFSTRIGTIINGRLLFGTAGFTLANFAKSDHGLPYGVLYGGWTVGVGIEQHLTPTLLLRAEYFYRQFPSARFQGHNFRIGVGIKF